METAMTTARTVNELAGEILVRLPWPTPPDEIDEVFAARAAAPAQGDLAKHIARSWLNIDRHLATYEAMEDAFSVDERDAISRVRVALRRVRVPAALMILVVLILQIVTSS